MSEHDRGYGAYTADQLKSEGAGRATLHHDSGILRTFATGATRDTAQNKPMYEGFIAPRVLQEFGRYMHAHRKQSDGSLRAPDNWQKGIPTEAYRDSLVRHVIDVWANWRDQGPVFDAKLERELLCAILFNAMGLLNNNLLEQDRDFNLFARALTGAPPAGAEAVP